MSITFLRGWGIFKFFVYVRFISFRLFEWYTFFMKTLLLIDAHSLIHRCFHALPPLTNATGDPVGALYGVASVLLKILSNKKPDYAAALFDRPEPTFRKELFPEYKAHRPKADDALVQQLIQARKLFESFSIPVFELPGFEGDDLIGTLATSLGKKEGVVAVVLTGDLDALQLVSDGRVVVETFKKGISETVTYNETAVFDRYNLTPSQLIEYKALVGDPSDNIPGVLGVGHKTAVSILQKYGTLDAFFARGQGEKSYEKILSQKKLAVLSRELATIRCDAPISTSLDSLIFSPSNDMIRSYFISQGFSSLERRVLSENKITHAHSPKPSSCKNPDKSVIVIDAEFPEFLNEDLQSPVQKIGWDLKDVYKLKPFTPPFFDIFLALNLLGVAMPDWRVASNHLFGEVFSKKDFLLKAYEWSLKELSRYGLSDLFQTIELPLIPILARMETRGIAIHQKTLSDVSRAMDASVCEAKDRVLSEISIPLNPNSPKQLLDYFQKHIGLKITSTSAQAIIKAKEKNPLPVFDLLLSYRELFKLKTTYVDALSRLVFKDGRIHPTFLQLGAATGRMSCQNPNLQNIPQESVWSAPIRNIFVSHRGYSLVSYDYSQIELRTLASLSGDPDMIRAFNENKDIHSLTASKLFSVPIDRVDSPMRRLAKTLNFGMIYGMGARALAQTAGITQDEAKEFIKKYFSEFSKVKEWQQTVLSIARRDGIVKNIHNRFRTLPFINSPNHYLVAESERVAINMPTQSLAADILKLSMIAVDSYLSSNNLIGRVFMLLSIHDELIFEIDDTLLADPRHSAVLRDIQKIMERCFDLLVPLRVDIKIGKRWGEMSSL